MMEAAELRKHDHRTIGDILVPPCSTGQLVARSAVFIIERGAIALPFAASRATRQCEALAATTPVGRGRRPGISCLLDYVAKS